MRYLLAILGTLVAAVCLDTPAKAQNYPWCEYLGGGMGGGGGRNCGFVTLEQCRETVAGMGGFCERNLFYTGPTERPVKHKRKRHDD